MSSEILFGNAALEGQNYAGWFIGHFITPPGDLRTVSDVEIKWGIHKAGDRRDQWGVNAATTLSILIRGHFCLRFADQEITLLQEGDYALWLPDVPHVWFVEEDSVVLTVRWPSVPTG